MYESTRIDSLKNAPEVKRVIQAADPSYKKHSAVLVQCESVELHGTYWDGGSRYTYTAVELATFRVKDAPQFNPPQFGGPQSSPVVTIPEGIAIVKTGTFCGRTASATVFINPANANKLLTAPV